MQVRSVSWPVAGDRATFRRRLGLQLAAGALAITGSVALAATINPALVLPLLPLAVGAFLLVLLWTHGTARAAARRAEVALSFAGLSVLHQGVAYAVDDRPILGEFPSRRQAARAALERGSWAVVVRAWDRYYLLAASPTATATPVSFRSRAVADIIPAIRDDVAS